MKKKIQKLLDEKLSLLAQLSNQLGRGAENEAEIKRSWDETRGQIQLLRYLLS